MNATDKIKHFEYVVKGLMNWYKEATGDNTNNDLSRLKVLKLLFFVSAVKAEESAPDESLIDKVFDKFVAMPYGHVESDIYQHLKVHNGVLTFFKIDTKCTIPTNTYNISTLDAQIDATNKTLIDNSIEELKKINPNLIRLEAFKLVDLSHSWYSWKKNYYSKASSSTLIPASDIKNEAKFFDLKLFNLKVG